MKNGVHWIIEGHLWLEQPQLSSPASRPLKADRIASAEGLLQRCWNSLKASGPVHSVETSPSP